jgi:antitoxin component YwqK of YwqJK toxin-antitoxin module
MNFKFTLLLLLLINGFSFLSQEKNIELTLSVNGTPASVEVDNSKKERQVNITDTYFWFKSNQIIQTVGGYQGQLLNGHYIESYPNGQLKLKGFFCYGQQCGEWKYWNEEGKLQRLENWRNNKLHGKVFYFKENGEVGNVKKYKKGNTKSKGILSE